MGLYLLIHITSLRLVMSFCPVCLAFLNEENVLFHQRKPDEIRPAIPQQG